MRKRRRSITVVNNKIDYDKLAEAIVKANEKSKSKKSTSKFRAALMGNINGAFYISISILSIFTTFGMWKDYAVNPKYDLATYIILTIVFIGIALYAFLCQQESLNDSAENSQQYFNTNISLIALIIALIALLKGVG